MDIIKYLIDNNSKPTTTQPKATTTQPKATTTQLKATTTQRKATTTQPKPTTTQPKATTTQPKATTTQPKAITIQPKPTTIQPKAITIQSKVTTDVSPTFSIRNLPTFVIPNFNKLENKDDKEKAVVHYRPLDYQLPVKPPKFNNNPTILAEDASTVPSLMQYKEGTTTLIPRDYGEYKLPRFLSYHRRSPVLDTNVEYAEIDIFDIYYNVPQKNDLAVMLVFFDYVGSARILMNYLYMVEKLKLANIPVFTLELVIHGKHPKIKDAFHVYGYSYLFQKEHLLRLLEKRIPAKFTKLACLDADILFDNPDWYDMVSESLETTDIVQPFRRAYWLNLDYTKIQKKRASLRDFDPNIHSHFWATELGCHPGFGWCFKREWYNAIGLYDLAVIGSGDTVFGYALFGLDKLNVHNQEYKMYIKSLYKWWETQVKYTEFADLNSNLYHMYHGPLKNRQYYDRFDAFKSYKNIEDIISKNENQVYELKVPKLNQHMLNFFRTREDDGID